MVRLHECSALQSWLGTFYIRLSGTSVSYFNIVNKPSFALMLVAMKNANIVVSGAFAPACYVVKGSYDRLTETYLNFD